MLWPNMYLRLRITHCIGAEEPALHTARAAVIFLSKMETGKYTVMIRSAKKERLRRNSRNYYYRKIQSEKDEDERET